METNAISPLISFLISLNYGYENCIVPIVKSSHHCAEFGFGIFESSMLKLLNCIKVLFDGKEVPYLQNPTKQRRIIGLL